MAFEPKNLLKVTTPEGDLFEFNASDKLPNQMYLYRTGVDNVAAVSVNTYFDLTGPNSPKRALLEAQFRIGDWLMCACSDGNVILRVTAPQPAVRTELALGTDDIADGAITTVKLANDAVDNSKLADNAVSLENLDAAITPSDIVKYADQLTTVGGAAAEAFAVAGILATDLAFVQIVDNGTANVTALEASCTANTLTVTFSGDPGNDCVFNYLILRAAA